MSDFGTYGYLIVNPTGKANNYEVIRFASWSESGGVVTVGTLTRNLDLQGTDNAGTGRSFPAGTIAIVGDNHHWANNLVQTEGAQTIAGVKTFSSLPATTAGNPVAGNDLANKTYVDATATGTTTVDRLVVAGTGGAVIADGNLIYLDTADGEWKLCDADTAATVDNVLLGIAQGAGTDGGAITNGVLLRGVDDAQAGMTIGEVMYASNTAGAIANSAGTTEVTVGYARTATELYFSPRENQQITEENQDDLALIAGAAAGDIFYSNGTILTILNIGTANQVLQTNSGATAPEWTTLPDKCKRITTLTAAVTVSNTTVETNLVSVSIPANVLGTTQGIFGRMFVSSCGITNTATGTLRIKYGSTTLSSLTFTGSGTTQNNEGYIDFSLLSAGTTGTQTGSLIYNLGAESADMDTNTAHARAYTTGTSSEDSTGALTFAITVQFDAADVINTIVVRDGYILTIED